MVDMGGNLGGVTVEVRANIDSLIKGFARAETATRGFEKDAQKSAGATADITKESQKLDSSLLRLQKSYAPLSGAAAKYRAELEQITRLEKANLLTAQGAASFRQKAGASYTQQAQAIKQATDNGTQFNAVLMRTAAILGAGLGAKKVIELADNYTRFTNQLKVAGIEGSDLAAVQERLFQISTKYGVELESLGGLYGKLSQAGKELGANQDQMIQFSNGVAAALKVQGGNASETSGALLQLTQALGSGIVHAQEFNSINNGARPIVQAVANGIDRMGGSVAKLRSEVIAGNVTSEEFFQGFLQGSKSIEAQAERANLTISQSTTILTNALTKYIGEANQANGVTAILATAIKALADNLDVIIPAIGVLAATIGVGYVRAAIAAATATSGFQAALLALAGNAGIAAVAIGLIALVAHINEIEKGFDSMGAAVDESSSSLQKAEERARSAGVNIDGLGKSTKDSKPYVDGLAGAMELAAKKALELANNTKLAAIASASLRKQQAETAIGDLQRMRTPRLTAAVLGENDPYIKARQSKVDTLIAQQQRIRDNAVREMAVVSATPDKAFNGGRGSGASAAATAAVGGSAGRGRAAAENVFEREKAQLDADQLQLQREATADLEEKARINKQIIDAKAIEANEGVEAQVHRKALTVAQGDQLKLEIAANADLEKEAVDRQLRSDQINRSFQYASDANAAERDLLQEQDKLATTFEDRRKIEEHILKLKQSQELAELEHLRDLANENHDQDQINEINGRIAKLKETQAAERQNFTNDNLGPMAAYKKKLDDTSKDIGIAVEQMHLDLLLEQLQRAAEMTNEVGSAFGRAASDLAHLKNPIDVFRGLISDLADTMIKNVIEQPVTDWASKAIGGPLAKQVYGKGVGDQLDTQQFNVALAMATQNVDALSRAAFMAANNMGVTSVSASDVTVNANAVSQAFQAQQPLIADFGAGLMQVLSGLAGGGGGGLLGAALQIGGMFAGAIGGGTGLAGVNTAGLSGIETSLHASNMANMGSYALPGHARGGLIRSSGVDNLISGGGTGTSDGVLRRVSLGEFVNTAQSTREFYPLLQGINSGRIPDMKSMGQIFGQFGSGGGQHFSFGSIHVSGVKDDREARRVGRQISATVQSEMAMASRKGFGGVK